MRMFVALVPPPEAVEDLDAFLAPRREAGAFRWALPEQFHVTLAFLAAVADRHLDELVERLERAGKRRTSFPTPDRRRRRLPERRPARGCSGPASTSTSRARPSSSRLATGARAAAARTGIAVDGQRFRPHVTVARLGRPAEVSSWVQLLDAYAGPAWTADPIALVASYLGEGPRKRPRYETVAEFALGSWPVRLLTTPET